MKNNLKIQRPRVYIRPFNKTNTDETIRIIHQSLEQFVSKFYSPEVIKGLKSLYTPENLKEKSNNPLTEIWVSRNRQNQINWTMSLNKYATNPNQHYPEQNQTGLEIKMFYGTEGLAFIEMLKHAKQRVLEKHLKHLSGIVIKSGWNGFTKRAGEGGTLYFSEPFEIIETNQQTKQEFSFEARYFDFIHQAIEEIKESSCLIA